MVERGRNNGLGNSSISGIGPHKKNRVLIVAIISVVVIILILLAILYFQSGKTSSNNSQTETSGDYKTCSALKSEWVNPDSNGNCPKRENKSINRITSPLDSPPEEGQICCYYYTLE